MKKIVLGTLLVGLIGILIVGAAIRTMDKTGNNVAEARGAEARSTEAGGAEGAGWRGGQGSSDQAIAREGRNQGAGALSAGTAAGEGVIAAEDWITYEGTVVQAPAAGTDMIVATDEGEEIVVGTGPGYLDEVGLSLQAGEQVQIQGYWEDDEFKAGQVTRSRDGATVALRDIYGRPAWSGAGQRQNATMTTMGEAVAGQGAGQQATGGQGAGGRGAGGQGAGGQGQSASAPAYGGYAGEGNLDATGDALGTGQAEVDEWLTLVGTVTVANDDELAVQVDGGGEVLLEGRALRFLQDGGFPAQIGQQLSLTGFYEDGDFEVGAVQNMTTGQSMMVRDENGRPLWAGRAGRSS